MAALGRRFLNIVAAGKYKPGLLSVHRLDVSNHLFYPSPSEALRSVHGDGNEAPMPRPPVTKTLQRLPAPCAIFSDASTAAAPAHRRSTAFFSLVSSPSSEGTRILFINEAGDSKMYYADKGCPSGHIHAMPSLENFVGPVAASVSVGSGSAGAKEEDSLYVMHGVLDGVAPRFHVLSHVGDAWSWQSLPPPPFVSSNVDDDDDEPDAVISAYTVVDGGGRTICVSSYGAEAGTWCFDTAQREWWHAGDWEMPFEGRAEYLADLGDLWLGVASGIAGPGATSTYEHGDLCTTSGLSSLSAVAVNQPPPTLLQRLYSLHDACVDWMVAPDIAKQVELMNLGSGRFAIARVFNCDNCFSSDWEYDPGDINEFDQLVLTGVEIRRRRLPRDCSRLWSCSDGLELIPHKSISYMCEYNHKIHQVL